MKVVDIADEIFRELDGPSDLSLPAIVFWLQTNYGLLNNQISTEYSLSSSGELVDTDGVEITSEPVAIYKQIYKVYRAKSMVSRHLGAAGVETVLSVDSDGAVVRKASKTMVAQEFRQLAKDEQKLLDAMINAYLQGKSLPRQVAGSDTIPASDTPCDDDYTREM